jgi:hypothetical protein
VDLNWQTLVAIVAGVVVVGLILWFGMRSQSANTPQSGTGTDQSAGAKPNVVSRVVSWTSMLARGGYRSGPTKSVRRKGNAVEVLLTDATRGDNPVKGWVVERSIHSVTFEAKEAFPAGSVAKVRPLKAGDDVPWLEIEVHECSPLDDEWKLACKFVKLPPYNILMLFG